MAENRSQFLTGLRQTPKDGRSEWRTRELSCSGEDALQTTGAVWAPPAVRVTEWRPLKTDRRRPQLTPTLINSTRRLTRVDPARPPEVMRIPPVGGCSDEGGEGVVFNEVVDFEP